MILFVAWVPPASIRQRLLLMMGGIAEARWQREDQLHCTVRYIGETDRHGRDILAQMLDRAEFALPPLRLDAMGRFSQGARAGHIWADVRPHGPQQALHRQLDRLCVRAGFAPEGRNYIPHITLARLNRRALAASDAFLAEYQQLTSEAFTVDRLVLFESRLGPKGSDYLPLESYPVAAMETS